MLNERELLIASYAIDRVSQENDERDLFFSRAEAELLLQKIHNVLKAIRR